MEKREEKYELIESSIAYIERLSGGIQKELEKMRLDGSLNDQAIIAIVEGLRDLLKAVHLTSDITEIASGDSYEQVKSCLSGLTEAYRNHDIVSIIDVLAYEVLSILDQWQEILTGAYAKRQEKGLS